MIAIIDYGMGNLKNIYKALRYVNADCIITSDPKDVLNCDGLVLPGVGAFKDAVQCILDSGLESSIKTSISQGKPFLGICLGMQLLFDISKENGEQKGLGIIPGVVDLINGDVKVPHMGWNNLDITNKETPLFSGLTSPFVYFVHSYHCQPKDRGIITATADYGDKITASLWKDNVHCVQFHPEKSGETGLKILDNFRRMVK